MAGKPPNLRLKPREKPYKRITIKQWQADLFEELENRAKRLNKKLPVYCRVVLEHAINYPGEYDELIQKGFDGELIGKEINIPVADQEFLENLIDWDPFGDTYASRIATTILIKHCDDHDW